MELVHKQLPTFEAKAQALHFFPVWRTWFSLHGLCKLPWNDIIPVSNKTAAEPSKVPEHIENYTWLHEGVTGIKVTLDDLMLQSERVYQFQRIFNLRLGFGTREHDYPPYRAVGPVTVIEYESRAERYDKQLKEEAGIDPAGLSSVEKVAAVRKYRTGPLRTARRGGVQTARLGCQWHSHPGNFAEAGDRPAGDRRGGEGARR